MLMFGMCVLGLLAGAARGELYWIAYEGDVFPEEEGWRRETVGTPPERSLVDGSLVIDSRPHWDTTDTYAMLPEHGLDPADDEAFVGEWRLRVEDSHLWAAAVQISSDDGHSVIFLIGKDSLLSYYEPDVLVALEAGVFHEFTLSSADMRTYALEIDGELAAEGSFFDSLFPGSVAGFGDLVPGGGCLAWWDYFRFGAVPEPSAFVILIAALGVLTRGRRCCSVRR
jgi:hypothetical protein